MSDTFLQYKINHSDKIYKLKSSAIILVDLFRNVNPTEIIELDSNVISEEILKVAAEYLTHWQDEPGNASYVKEEVLQTNNIEQILNKFDLTLINNYVNMQYEKQTAKNRKIIETNHFKKKMFKIESLNSLLETAGGYLGIQSLTNKICAYIAALIWNCSLYELNEVFNNKEFIDMQQQTVSQWHNNNPTYSSGDGISDLQRNSIE